MGILLGHQPLEIAHVTGSGPEEDLPRARPEASARLALSGAALPQRRAAAMNCITYPRPHQRRRCYRMLPGCCLLWTISYRKPFRDSASGHGHLRPAQHRHRRTRNDHSSRTPAERGCARRPGAVSAMISSSALRVLVMAADPGLERLPLVAPLRHPVEDRVVAHQELHPAPRGRIGLVDDPVSERENAHRR